MIPMSIISVMSLVWMSIILRLLYKINQLKNGNPVDKIELTKNQKRFRWVVFLGVPIMSAISVLVFLLFAEHVE
jgi:Na+/H+ antiporter NhaD/arsenite permease-like protein